MGSGLVLNRTNFQIISVNASYRIGKRGLVDTIKMKTDNISRFEIVQALGTHSLGAEYLVSDDQNQPFNLVRVEAAIPELDTMLQELGLVKSLEHENIVPLNDFIIHQDRLYLVYPNVEGQSLSEVLRSERRIDPLLVAKIMSDVLAGLDYAFRLGVTHLRLNPECVILTPDGVPRIRGFGIGHAIVHAPSDVEVLRGLLRGYVAPEWITGGEFSGASDIFSVGMMIYALVTGELQVESASVHKVLMNTDKVAHSPSNNGIEIDTKIVSVILRAISKDPKDRYPDAFSMIEEIQGYIDPEWKSKSHPKVLDKVTHSKVDYLLSRMRSKSDFPVLSATISEINKVVTNDKSSTNHLTQIILQDFALTNKLLQLVNTVSYGQFGGNIHTISKAVTILGFDTVRNVAMTLILFDFLQNKSQASQLKDEVILSFFSGIVASNISGQGNQRLAEEVMICSMFINLGELLTTFYFYDESQKISRLMGEGESESRAVLNVLGISYNELAIEVARSWSFPNRLLIGMRKLSDGVIDKPTSELETMSTIVNLANELCGLACKTSSLDKTRNLRALKRRYEKAFSFSEQQLSDILDKGFKELQARSHIMRIDLSQCQLITQAKLWMKERASVKEDRPFDASSIEAKDESKPYSSEEAKSSSLLNVIDAVQSGYQHAIDSETVLSSGIHDVINTLVGDYQVNDIVQMLLETMYRAMGFDRAIFLFADTKKNRMSAKFGFGKGVDEIQSKFNIPLDFQLDVFHLSIQKGLDVLIEDVDAENIKSKIPAWYNEHIRSKSFLLLPVVIKEKPFGIFYADRMEAKSMDITTRQLTLLKTLRNQAILAIKQKN